MSQRTYFGSDHSAQSYDALYETDPRHLAVDEYVKSHLLPNSKPYHPDLEKICKESLAAGLPDIACSPAHAKFLKLQVQMSGALHVLEIGTMGGYSAAWMATAGLQVKVTTIEVNEQYVTLARKHLYQAGLSSQVEVIQGAALEVLPDLLSQVESGDRPPFDFVFIDANKQDNVAYFNHSLSMTRPRATIIVDNIVRNGKVASVAEAEKDDRILGTRQLIEALNGDDRVEATVIQTVGEKNYDGFLIAVKQ